MDSPGNLALSTRQTRTLQVTVSFLFLPYVLRYPVLSYPAGTTVVSEPLVRFERGKGRGQTEGALDGQRSGANLLVSPRDPRAQLSACLPSSGRRQTRSSRCKNAIQ